MSGRRIKVLLYSLLLLAPSASRAQETKGGDSRDVILRAHIQPEGTVYVGQKVTLTVEVLVNSWFTSAPKYPDLEVLNAVVLRPEQFATNFTDRINGQTYAGQARGYYIYPRKPGAFKIPSLSVTVNYSLPDRKPSGDVAVDSPELQFEAVTPDGAQGLAFVATPRMTVKDDFNRDIASLKVGDSFVRTITLEVEDSAGMMIPPLEWEEIEGLGVYPDSPQVSDQSNRGTFNGKRVESVTYIMENEGDYVLPEITLHWWDTKAQELKTEAFPALEFKVLENPDLDLEHVAFLGEEDPDAGDKKTGLSSTQARQMFASVLGLLVLVTLLVFLAYRLWPRASRRLISWLAQKRRERAEAEVTHFRRFEKACTLGDPRKAMSFLLSWIDRVQREAKPPTVARFTSRYGDAYLAAEVSELERRLFSEEAEKPRWDGNSLRKAMKSARRRMLRGATYSEKEATGVLLLNPRG